MTNTYGVGSPISTMKMEVTELGPMKRALKIEVPADEVAQAAGTISYELFCRLTPRVRRVPPVMTSQAHV